MKQELIAGLILFLIGLGLLLLPAGKLWALTEKWKSKGEGGPSRTYTVVMRVLGAVFSAAGLGVFISGL